MRKRFSDNSNLCRQYNPCACLSICEDDCMCFANGTTCEKYCGYSNALMLCYHFIFLLLVHLFNNCHFFFSSLDARKIAKIVIRDVFVAKASAELASALALPLIENVIQIYAEIVGSSKIIKSISFFNRNNVDQFINWFLINFAAVVMALLSKKERTTNAII